MSFFSLACASSPTILFTPLSKVVYKRLCILVEDRSHINSEHSRRAPRLSFSKERLSAARLPLHRRWAHKGKPHISDPEGEERWLHWGMTRFQSVLKTQSWWCRPPAAWRWHSVPFGWTVILPFCQHWSQWLMVGSRDLKATQLFCGLWGNWYQFN